MIFFIYPMWDSESQRIGKQKCSAIAYKIHAIADLIGFSGLLLLIGLVIAELLPNDKISWWFFFVPFVISFIGWLVLQFSWFLVAKKGFKYDYKNHQANWLENGEAKSYKYEP